MARDDRTEGLVALRGVTVNFDRLPEEFAAAFRASDFYEAEDDEGDMPFFSECFLYPLVGKDAARTLLGALDSLEAEAARGVRLPGASLTTAGTTVTQVRDEMATQLIQWLHESPRRPSWEAFANGPLRRVAYSIQCAVEAGAVPAAPLGGSVEAIVPGPTGRARQQAGDAGGSPPLPAAPEPAPVPTDGLPVCRICNDAPDAEEEPGALHCFGCDVVVRGPDPDMVRVTWTRLMGSAPGDAGERERLANSLLNAATNFRLEAAEKPDADAVLLDWADDLVAAAALLRQPGAPRTEPSDANAARFQTLVNDWANAKGRDRRAEWDALWAFVFGGGSASEGGTT